ncbi:alpha/beta fold hydrolase [Lentzea sp. NPDC051213]|uniref:alpha/beta fold hydrolase n=1 Tax=Lentzea sp. NPDC051213 TaxID=3364126 RepID=UPI003793F372
MKHATGRWSLVLSVTLVAGAFGSGNLMATAAATSCDKAPTGVSVSDEWLSFAVPAGLMPDPKFDGRTAKIQVHRVKPVYARGKCAGTPNRAAVLVHGSRVSGTPSFDLRHNAPGGGTLSTQQALALAGIDTFAPSLLGYGRSTRFADGLDDPGNASLRPYNADGSCSHLEGCDRAHLPIFPLDQQGTLLLTNPLDGQRSAHSTGTRFARTDVFVRDIRQVVNYAIAHAKPSDRKVTLIGWSFGANYVAATLHANPAFSKKVNRVVFHSSGFDTPTQEVVPADGFTSFPTNLATRDSIVSGPTMPPGRAAVCTGHRIPGTQEQLWNQMMQEDSLGSTWGAGTAGLHRSPTFSLYGWNSEVAAELTTPSLIIHGTDDTVAKPEWGPAIYNSLAAPNKVLVQVQCGSHLLHLAGCSGDRCTPESGTPYGGRPGEPWAGPYSTYQAALTEWINNGTFAATTRGHFVVNESGVANPSSAR